MLQKSAHDLGGAGGQFSAKCSGFKVLSLPQPQCPQLSPAFPATPQHHLLAVLCYPTQEVCHFTARKFSGASKYALLEHIDMILQVGTLALHMRRCYIDGCLSLTPNHCNRSPVGRRG